MKHELTARVNGHEESLEISEQTYATIMAARYGLLEVLYIEEKFDLLIEDYLEFETDLLDIAMEQMVRWRHHYLDFQMHRSRINLRVINLLSACKMYLDHSAHHLNNLFNKDDARLIGIIQERSNQYDMHLGYRAMEALRNHVQHRGYPIHATRYNSKMLDVEKRDKFLYSLTPLLDTATLEEDDKFNKKVLGELKMLGEAIDIKPLLRQYVESLGHIHQMVRTAIGPLAEDWGNTIQGTIQKFSDTFESKEPLNGIRAVISTDATSFKDGIWISQNIIKYRQELEGKTPNLVNLSKRYVTGEIISD